MSAASPSPGASTASSAGCSGATRARRSSTSSCRCSSSRCSARSSPASRRTSTSSCPGIAGMSIVSTTFIALAHNLVFLREQGVLKRLRGTPLPCGAYLGGARRARGDQRRDPAGDRHRRRAAASSASAGRRTGSRSRVFAGAGRRLLRRARRRAGARDPELRLRARVRQRDLPAADLHQRRLLRRRRRARVPARHRRGAAADAPHRRPVGGDGHRRRVRRHLATSPSSRSGPSPAIVLAVRGFSWERAGAELRAPPVGAARARQPCHAIGRGPIKPCSIANIAAPARVRRSILS